MEGERVLAIEHDWRLRKLIRANLEPLGLSVQEAVGAEHGLELLRASAPDLILLDLDLPDLDLTHFVGRILALCSQPLPIIVISAEPPTRQFMQQAPTTSHLQKPFAAPALLEQVQRALNHRDASGGSPSRGI